MKRAFCLLALAALAGGCAESDSGVEESVFDGTTAALEKAKDAEKKIEEAAQELGRAIDSQSH